MILLTMPVFLSTNYYKRNTLLSHIVAKMKRFTCHFSICLKTLPKTSLICIASTMFQLFSNIVKNIEVNFFFRTSPKNDIVKNWETSHRQKHRIIKKSEHRPPLLLAMEISKAMDISMGINFGYCMEFSMAHGNFHGGSYHKVQDPGNFHGVGKFP